MSDNPITPQGWPGYTELVAYGHSPAKALEIAIDASRGDDFSARYINFVRHSLPPAPGESA